MVFREHAAVGPLALGDGPDRPGWQGLVLCRHRAADRLDDGAVAVDQRNRRVHDLALCHAGTGDDERHRGQLVVHHRLAPQSPAAEVLAVVGRVDDAGGVRQSGRVESGEDLSDIVVEEAHQRIVGCDGEPHGVEILEVVVIVHDGPQRLHRRVPHASRLVVEPRQRHPGRIVKREELRRRGQREMRAHERDEQRPGLVAVALLHLREPRQAAAVTSVS